MWVNSKWVNTLEYFEQCLGGKNKFQEEETAQAEWTGKLHDST